LNRGWKDELEKNYEKSLDHRSFYFKQNDKKQLTTKSILSGVKAVLEEGAKRDVTPVLEVQHPLSLPSPSPSILWLPPLLAWRSERGSVGALVWLGFVCRCALVERRWTSLTPA
jgi:hypothetical protein